MTNEILLHVGMFWGLFVFTLNKHKDKNLATLATHIILKKIVYNLISGLQKSIRSPPSLKKWFFFHSHKRGFERRALPFL